METKDAIKHLVTELKKDEGYYYSWQSNIAVQLQDACKEIGIQFPQLHEVSNRAAMRFLEVLCTYPKDNPNDQATK